MKDHLIARGTQKEIADAGQCIGWKGVGSSRSKRPRAILEVLTRKANSVRSRAVRRRLPRLGKLLDHDDEMIVQLAAETLGAWKVDQVASAFDRLC